MSADPHPDDIFHVFIDGVDRLLKSDEEVAWASAGYDEGISPMGDIDGYRRTLHDARAFATAVLDQGRSDVVRGAVD